MELTWITIAASLFMGIGAVLVFVFAVKKNYFHNLEDAKYQVFWTDVEDLVKSAPREKKHEDSKQSRS
ncbi:MAG TPA: cbb3-type cytochrome oxidase assembly protein CcoS [Dongiaceae bacterium]|nr:cbb3-type cytochrome oxidase assembly protein CcoS [Dongiaceae bacterium]